MRTLHSLHYIEVNVCDVGITVRRGTKWADAYPGEHIVLCECRDGEVFHRDSHTVAGEATVLETVTCKFRDIPARLIEQEHEISSRMYSGLLASMRRAYGEEFSEDDTVVVLSYERVA